jgi:hypothetical protein
MKYRPEKKFVQEFDIFCFFFGFHKCDTDPTINFLKINVNEYLLLKVFCNGTVIDLIHAKFDECETPCYAEPNWEELIRQGFDLKNDKQILKDLIKNLKG